MDQVKMKIIFLTCLLAGLVPAQGNPYKEMDSLEIDSDEHGVGPGAKGTTCPCGWANRVKSRIVGGRKANLNQFPFIVGIMPRGRRVIFCGGTIISEYHILTAAHCFEDIAADDLDVVVGEHSTKTEDESKSTKVINVATLKLHPDYESKNFHNDIALITVAEKITFNRDVGPACMPDSRTQYNTTEQYVKVLGWGRTEYRGRQAKTLLHANLRSIPLSICKENLKKIISLENPTQICTFSKERDTCQGDSGGPVAYLDPLTNRYALVGIVSYGFACAYGLPSVSTDVSAYLKWISDSMAETNPDVGTCRRE